MKASLPRLLAATSTTTTTRSAESSAALRQLFGWIEARYGGLPLDNGSAAEVIVADNLQTTDLTRLFRHEATALHIPHFYPTEAAAAWGKELAREAQRGKGMNWKVSTSRGLESSDVTTIGAHVPYNVATAMSQQQQHADAHGSSGTEAYFTGVRQEFRQRRRSSLTSTTSRSGTSIIPTLWPLDQLRLELDEAWSQGAGLAREETGERRPFGGGLPRIMMGPTRWKKGFVHVDEMGPLNPQQGLFSANIYLQLPNDSSSSSNKSNGNNTNNKQRALEIWPLGIRNRWDWYRNALLLSGLSSQDPEMQVMLRAKLGEPTSIEVEPGDLVLICTQRPHAAVGFQQGTRVSLQCFLQYNGPEKRLLIDT